MALEQNARNPLNSEGFWLELLLMLSSEFAGVHLIRDERERFRRDRP